MHHRPVHRLVERRLRAAGKHVIVRLRPAQPKHPPKRPHQLVLQLHLLAGIGARTPSVQHQDGVLNITRGNDRIDALGHPVLPAVRRIARPVAQQKIGHRTVAVVDHRNLFRQRSCCSRTSAGKIGPERLRNAFAPLTCSSSDPPFASVRLDVGAFQTLAAAATRASAAAWFTLALRFPGSVK